LVTVNQVSLIHCIVPLKVTTKFITSNTAKGKYSVASIARKDIKTVTLQILKFPLVTSQVLRVWDTYGWTEDEDSWSEEFEYVLNGNIQDGFKVEKLKCT
jgi:hypothetical protein